MHPSVHLLTISNKNISATIRLIGIKFYLKHQWGAGKAALGFRPDQIRTLVSMKTDSPQRVIMGKKLSTLCSNLIFDRIYFILAGNKDNHKISDKFEIRPDTTPDCGVSCP